MTRRVFRALPVGEAPIRWEATIGQGAAQTVPAGLTINPPAEPEPEPPVIQVGWGNGFSEYTGDSGPLPLDTDLYAEESATANSAGVLSGGESVVRFASVVGAATSDIEWHASFVSSGGGTLHPDIGALYSALCIRYLGGTNEYALGVYTFTPYIDGVAASPITFELVEE